MPPRGKVQKEHFRYFTDVMAQIEWDLHDEVLAKGRIPRDWHEIAKRRGKREKVRLTLRVEEDVVKFFRATGRGYQERMNDVLRAWMHGRIAGMIEGPDAEDIALQLKPVTRPRVGDGALMDAGFVRLDGGQLFDLDKKKVMVE